MRFESKEPKIKYLLLQDKIVADKVNKDIQERIESSARSIPEGLQGHYFPERRVKKINNCNNLFLGHTYLNVSAAKVV
jgi:hypothetical protein